MPQDTSLYNNNILSNDTLCHFRDFVGRQDEVPELFFQNNQLKYVEIGRNDSDIIVQKKIKAYKEIEFFPTKQYKTNTTNIKVRRSETFDFVSVLLLVSVVLFVITQFFFYQKIKSVFQIGFSHKKTNIQQLTSEKIQFSFGGVILAFLYYISISLSLVQILLPLFVRRNVILAFWELFFSIVAFIIIYRIIVFLLQQLLAFVFEIRETYRLSSKNSIAIQSIIGLFLLPINIVIAYTTQYHFLYISVLILVILSVYRFVRSIYLSKRTTSFSWFHIILYFCISEVLPLLILVKMGMKFIPTN
jgi:Domain of unknown function (DUF4271)